MKKKRLRIIAQGKVQGVSFRYYTKDAAQALGLTGFVKNREDGSVEIIAEGDESKLAKLLKWSYDGPGAAEVSSVQKEWLEPSGEFNDFLIIM